MVFRRTDRERELVQEEDANGLNIVSGDDDLLAMSSVRDIPIVAPAAFVRAVSR